MLPTTPTRTYHRSPSRGDPSKNLNSKLQGQNFDIRYLGPNKSSLEAPRKHWKDPSHLFWSSRPKKTLVPSYGHTTVDIPHPIRTAKSSTVGLTQYCGGGPRGNRECCMFFTLAHLFWSSSPKKTSVPSYGHTTVDIPHPIRTAKSSTVGLTQYCGGGPRGNRECCMFFVVLHTVLHFKHRWAQLVLLWGTTRQPPPGLRPASAHNFATPCKGF